MKMQVLPPSVKIFQYFRGKNPAFVDILFEVIPPSVHNPLMLPILLFMAIQNKELHDTNLISAKEFVEIASQQCMKETSIPIFHLVLLLTTHSKKRCTAARWFVRNGFDPNELGIHVYNSLVRIQLHVPKFYRLKRIEQVELLSPLGVACALHDVELVRTLLAIGADSSLACLTSTSSDCVYKMFATF